MRAFGSLCLCAMSAPVGLAQAPRTSAPITEMRYEVTADSAAVRSRELVVTTTFHVSSTAPVVLALPAWSPGHYVLLWFAQRVSRFTAESNGAALEWRKLDYQTWEIRPRSAGTVRVTFHYLADAVDRAVAWTSPSFAFFNGTNVFLYPVGRGFEWPASVTVRTEPGWRVVTGMDPALGMNSFGARNYHDLVDMPFFVGRFDVDSTLVSDRWIRLAMYPAGSMTAARRDRTFAWLQKLVPAEAAVFGEAPFRNYTIFQLSDTVVNGGGLEHQSSQMDEVLTSQLDAPGLIGLYSHELFHAWNVKRLRPADLVPYRYDAAQPTQWLWVSEGVTDYYGSVSVVRAGIRDSSDFFDSMANAIASVEGAPPTALSDVSLSAWIGGVDGSAGLYYPKGSLVGFLLDIMIRDASDNRHSLDDVMRDLYQATYKKGKGFTRSDWWSAVSRAAGTVENRLGNSSFGEFARRYIDGREPLPLDSVLPLAGLRARGDTIREPRLGVSTASDSTGARITDMGPSGAAAAAGARLDDRIVSIGDVSIVNDASFEAFRARYAGTAAPALPMVLRRGGETLTLQLPVRLVARTRVRVLPMPDASAKALRIRRGILRGERS